MITMSCDDGCRSDLKVAKLAKKYNVKTVFYIPVEWKSLAYDNGYEPLNYMDLLFLSKYFEIGSHSITHRHLTKIPFKEAIREITDSKLLLESIINKPVTKFCPPRGYTNDQCDAVIETYYASQRLTKGAGLVHVHPNSGANGNVHWLEYAKNNPVEELWFHSWELDKYNEWDNLEIYLNENIPR